ncbi:MAG: hypothetical protein MUF42_03890 [Cytophagaceae bacterium]|jgi:hypothetical protein|nr:hypothetical protein [Cytophagaceae bacterium]
MDTFQESLQLKLSGLGFSSSVSGISATLAFHCGTLEVIGVPYEAHTQSFPEDYWLGYKLQRLHSGINVVFIWQDRWEQQQELLLARLAARLGKIPSLHARHCSIHDVTSEEWLHFTKQHHPGVSLSLPIRYGLYQHGVLLAAAGFARPRAWKKPERNYLSLELVRYVSSNRVHINGGLSKLLDYAEKKWMPDDIMTYIDLDWSDGKGFEQIGFKKISTTGPISFFVNSATHERLHSNRMAENSDSPWMKVMNCGSLKMIRTCHPS